MTKKESSFLDLIGTSEETLHIAAHKVSGIHGWFAAFIKSSDFVELDENLKEEALNTFLGLKFILEEAEGVALACNKVPSFT